MCIIIDVNLRDDFFDEENNDMKPIHNWIKNKNGKLVLGGILTKEFYTSLSRDKKTKIDLYREQGRLKTFNNINKGEQQLGNVNLKSNDRHIIALALEANVKVLVSKDKPLHEDFKNIVGGSVYQDKNHEHLLTPDTCP